MLKSFVKLHPGLMKIPMHIANRLNFKNKLKVGKGNKLEYGSVWLKGLNISCCGKGNKIVISDNCKIRCSRIVISGNDNVIELDEHVYINSSTLTLIGNGGRIHFGKDSTVNGRGEFAALEGASVEIGERCMISTDVQLRTGDSHIIYNESGQRINFSKSISIGNHVWLGVKSMCLKGTMIADDSIVGAMSLVSGKFEKTNCIIAGVPAKVLKEDVNWER